VPRRLVLLTGAAGRIGTAFRMATGERFRFRLADVVAGGLADTPGEAHEILALDITDAAACRAACAGVDAVVHLAADPSPEAGFETSLAANNVAGTLNVVSAARDAGCRRVVFASSGQTVMGYPPGTVVSEEMPVWPVNLYGASKCWGEALCAMFATGRLSCVAVRIGAYDSPWLREHGTPGDRAAYVSARDLNALLVRCVEAEIDGHAIVFGVSDNHPNRFDLRGTRMLLGYAPQDDGLTLG
jgi:nucleoside-diphosphate-sugar epimerase